MHDHDPDFDLSPEIQSATHLADALTAMSQTRHAQAERHAAWAERLVEARANLGDPEAEATQDALIQSISTRAEELAEEAAQATRDLAQLRANAGRWSEIAESWGPELAMPPEPTHGFEALPEFARPTPLDRLAQAWARVPRLPGLRAWPFWLGMAARGFLLVVALNLVALMGSGLVGGAHPGAKRIGNFFGVELSTIPAALGRRLDHGIGLSQHRDRLMRGFERAARSLF